MVMLSPEDRAKVAMAYDNIALSIAAFEASAESNAFTSKFDQSKGGKAKLTQQERRGFALFQGKGKCKNCHLSAGQNPLFTDFTFDNLGIPKNPDNPFYGMPPEETRVRRVCRGKPRQAQSADAPQRGPQARR
jgi:cytochrome c peroxidase